MSTVKHVHDGTQCPMCMAPVKMGLYHNDALINETARATAAEVKYQKLQGECQDQRVKDGFAIQQLQSSLIDVTEQLEQLRTARGLGF